MTTINELPVLNRSVHWK